MTPTTSGTHDTMIRDALSLAQSLASWAIVRTRSSRVSMTATKNNPADYVTDIDLSVEQWVRDSVLREFGDHAFVGEEHGARGNGDYTWYCDPVDGTTNFHVGLPWHSFSLALVDAHGPVVGVVADPRTQEVFSAARGRGAHLNGVPLQVAPRTELTGGVVLTEWLGCAPWPGMSKVLSELSRRYVTVRIMGSSTLSVCGLAAGRGHGTLVGEFGDVDLLAATLICDEAGLAVRNERNERDLRPASGGLLVANQGLVDELHQIWAAARN